VTELGAAEAVIFDVDGTLVHAAGPDGLKGAEVIPGAIETLQRVRDGGRRVLVFTNGNGKRPDEYVADLNRLGFPLEPGEFINPAVVSASWIASQYPEAAVLPVGGEGVTAPLADAGVRMLSVEEGASADVVLVGWDQSLTYPQFRAACTAIWNGAPLLSTSNAAVISVQGGRAPGWSGAITAGIERTTGVEALVLGKPAPQSFEQAAAMLDADPRRVAMIGDDLGIDIAMARRAGAPAVLVLSGTATQAEADALEAELQPTAVVEDVRALPDLLADSQ
jgi:HAD superfamily hydrolase (TIGR01450 family)